MRLVATSLDREQIDILSLGCGDSEMTISDAQVLRGGLWHWRDIVSSAIHLSSQNALGQAGLLIGRDRLMRLNAPLLPDGPIGLDDVKRAKAELPNVAKELALTYGPAVASRFFNENAEPYVPFHP